VTKIPECRSVQFPLNIAHSWQTLNLISETSVRIFSTVDDFLLSFHLRWSSMDPQPID